MKRLKSSLDFKRYRKSPTVFCTKTR